MALHDEQFDDADDEAPFAPFCNGYKMSVSPMMANDSPIKELPCAPCAQSRVRAGGVPGKVGSSSSESSFFMLSHGWRGGEVGGWKPEAGAGGGAGGSGVGDGARAGCAPRTSLPLPNV